MINKMLKNFDLKKMRTNPKAQVEIMGLMIIVIIVVFVMFFVISMTLTKKPENIRNTYSNDQISTAFLLALLDSSSECTNEVSIREVIQDCAVARDLNCGVNSCDYLNEQLPIILGRTMDMWGKNYKFRMDHYSFEGEGDGQYNNFQFSQGCEDTALVYREAFQVIPLWPRSDSVKVSLSICNS
jgi:hypothetical protein